MGPYLYTVFTTVVSARVAEVIMAKSGYQRWADNLEALDSLWGVTDLSKAELERFCRERFCEPVDLLGCARTVRSAGVTWDDVAASIRRALTTHAQRECPLSS